MLICFYAHNMHHRIIILLVFFFSVCNIFNTLCLSHKILYIFLLNHKNKYGIYVWYVNGVWIPSSEQRRKKPLIGFANAFKYNFRIGRVYLELVKTNIDPYFILRIWNGPTLWHHKHHSFFIAALQIKCINDIYVSIEFPIPDRIPNSMTIWKNFFSNVIIVKMFRFGYWILIG